MHLTMKLFLLISKRSC